MSIHYVVGAIVGLSIIKIYLRGRELGEGGTRIIARTAHHIRDRDFTIQRIPENATTPSKGGCTDLRHSFECVYMLYQTEVERKCYTWYDEGAKRQTNKRKTPACKLTGYKDLSTRGGLSFI